MTHDEDPPDGLDPEAMAVAAALRDAFAGVVLERPSPATTPDQDAETAALLEAEFAGVTQDRPRPSPTAVVPVVGLGTPSRRRALGWLVAAAVTVVAFTLILTLEPTGGGTAWAATPTTPTAADVRRAADACAAPLAQGLGHLQSSGSMSVDGSTAPPAPSGDTTPTALPPLAVLDVRGDLAFAVYQDVDRTVSCMLQIDGDDWRDQGVQVGPGSSAVTPGLTYGTVTTPVDGSPVSTIGGSAPAGTTSVRFRLTDGTEVEASVLGTQWAAWFPGDRALDRASITAYSEDGTPRQI